MKQASCLLVLAFFALAAAEEPASATTTFNIPAADAVTPLPKEQIAVSLIPVPQADNATTITVPVADLAANPLPEEQIAASLIPVPQADNATTITVPVADLAANPLPEEQIAASHIPVQAAAEIIPVAELVPLAPTDQRVLPQTRSLKKRNCNKTPKGPSGNNADAGFLTKFKQHQDSCRCVQAVCFCCFTIAGLEAKTCINFNQGPAAKTLKVDALIEGVPVVSQQFSNAAKNQVCAPLPAQIAPNVNLCVYQVNTPQKDGSIQSCVLLAFSAGSVGSRSNINLKCLNLKKSGLLYGGQSLVQIKNQVFVQNSSPNFKAVIDGLRKGKK